MTLSVVEIKVMLRTEESHIRSTLLFGNWMRFSWLAFTCEMQHLIGMNQR